LGVLPFRRWTKDSTVISSIGSETDFTFSSRRGQWPVGDAGPGSPWGTRMHDFCADSGEITSERVHSMACLTASQGQSIRSTLIVSRLVPKVRTPTLLYR